MHVFPVSMTAHPFSCRIIQLIKVCSDSVAVKYNKLLSHITFVKSGKILNSKTYLSLRVLDKSLCIYMNTFITLIIYQVLF